MATRTEIGVVYGAAVVQGLALVTFPAASSVFTSPDGFGFDSTRYGTMFVPQVALAICAAALGPRLARRWSLRRVLLAGLVGDIFSMSLLALSRSLIGAPDAAFGLLLVATAALGFGFGATVVALVLALGAWWLLPAAVACMLAFISAIAVTQPLRSAGGTDATAQTAMRWS